MRHDTAPHNPKSDRISIIVLLVAFVAGGLVVFLWGGDNHGADAENADSIVSTNADASKKDRFHRKKQYYYYQGEYKAELFPFDPNTADSTTLLRLGLKPWQVRNIYKYRAKGGIYRRPADFANLYDLTAGEYRRLEPYIRISPEFLPASELPEVKGRERDTLRYPVKIGEGEHVVLNTADTTTLKRVPGIGSGFARAIVSYGKRLGGYVNVDQLDEIEDFPQESKRFFIVNDPNPEKLNVNRLTVVQLRRHPYITFHQAKAIVDYRRMRGPLVSLQDMRLHRDFTDEAIKRLEPYVEF